MRIHLVDGTFELFRAYYGGVSVRTPAGEEVGAVRALARSLWGLVQYESATHVACAFDTVIESFRNELFPGYKTGEGIEPELFAQFPLAEEAACALGFVVWRMIEFEADDALATAAALLAEDPAVEQVVICTPDKDLAQCVVGERVVRRDRIRRQTLDEAGVRDRYGIAPASIPDWLALVGDASDGIPGIPRWGEKSASTVLGRYATLDAIPDRFQDWAVKVRGAAGLAENLTTRREEALLYRELATLRRDVPLEEAAGDLLWRGARPAELERLCEVTGDRVLRERVLSARVGS